MTTPGGHCHFWGGEAGSPAAIGDVVRRQVEHGADWIKVMATGGVFTPGSRAVDSQFDAESLAGIVALAADHGLAVAAHCHGTGGIANATAAAVRTIEHCSFAGPGGFGVALAADLPARITASGAFVSPTVNTGWERRRLSEGRPTAFFMRMSGVLRALRAAGTPLIASTDAGIPGVEHHRLPEALAVFARYAGLSAREALASATSTAARGLGLAGETGAIVPGLAADVLVVDGDPLTDLAALRRPLLVVARGRVVTPV